MKEIWEDEFSLNFREQLLFANFHVRKDVLEYFEALKNDLPENERRVVDIFIENNKLAENENRALCQDTGYVQLFVKIGRDVHLNFDLEKVVNQITAETYQENFLRLSLAHSVTRKNTGNNLPVFIDMEFTESEILEVAILLKGGGSENVSRAGYILPTASESEIVDWVVDTIKSAGAKACPPYIIGVGIGANLEKAVYYSKKQLLERIDESHMDEIESDLSNQMKTRINSLPIGFQGLRFAETAMSVKVKCTPCHIATLPIAVSIGCNSVRQGFFSL